MKVESYKTFKEWKFLTRVLKADSTYLVSVFQIKKSFFRVEIISKNHLRKDGFLKKDGSSKKIDRWEKSITWQAQNENHVFAQDQIVGVVQIFQ